MIGNQLVVRTDRGSAACKFCAQMTCMACCHVVVSKHLKLCSKALDTRQISFGKS